MCKFQSFVKESFPTAECLATAVVSRDVVEQLQAIADEAVAQGSWFEVRLGNQPPACMYFVSMPFRLAGAWSR